MNYLQLELDVSEAEAIDRACYHAGKGIGNNSAVSGAIYLTRDDDGLKIRTAFTAWAFCALLIRVESGVVKYQASSLLEPGVATRMIQQAITGHKDGVASLDPKVLKNQLDQKALWHAVSPEGEIAYFLEGPDAEAWTSVTGKNSTEEIVVKVDTEKCDHLVRRAVLTKLAHLPVHVYCATSVIRNRPVFVGPTNAGDARP